MILNDTNQRKKLSELEPQSFESEGVWSNIDPLVYGISSDSKNIFPGFIFFAINGSSCHGADFATDAVERGAILVITDYEGAKILENGRIETAIMIVSNPRQKLADYSARWNGIQPKIQVAVTGTNGKTSVCHFVKQIWEFLGYKTASIGTLGVHGEFYYNLKNTTPDPVLLHKILGKLSERGVDRVVMEASSHGLHQFRLDGVILKAAAFTNLSRDHLDYHTDEDEYLASKCILFDRVLPNGQIVVLNIDDPYAQVVKLISESKGHKVIKVGTHISADLRICDHRFDSDGQSLKIKYLDKTYVISLPLIGAFQATNVLIAAALTTALGASVNDVINLLPALKAVPGRMELVGIKKPWAKVYVDYAHTPEALLSALKALRPHTIGKLVLVFGAGGERDIGKRPLMGKIAQKHADMVFITDDNPRYEEPKQIRSAILKECPQGKEIGDRASAILTAIDEIQEGDVLLISGKGHETGQLIGDDFLPFNDKEFVSMSLALLEGNKV